MSQSVRAAIKSRVLPHKPAKYRQGYKYATVALLCGDETPASILGKILMGNISEFDRGMLAAGARLIRHGVVSSGKQ
ncbi:MAG: hypothetical protein KJ558_10010 [Gammaproteobacteria bacterium]|nr:hypothetical protein [Gammaproteobacteria bacterium]MBU1959682.1 hypothetical protein [Gammaproteobacteria bacterium]